MRFWRIECGRWKSPVRCRKMNDYFTTSYDRCASGCKIFAFGPFYLTWLSGDCYKKDE